MRVWRICRRAHAADALSGRGGLFVSGRWHSRGRRIVYTSGSLSLAALEILVHVDQTELPRDLFRIEVEIPDDVSVERIDASALPTAWRTFPAPPALQELGDGWLQQQKALVLEVPSAVIPEEYNYLLNPAHPDAARLVVVSSREFVYDPRIVGR